MQQKLSVPLFQRPYVWNRELQWEPLWRDMKRVLERYENDINETHQPHFLGAVVLQQVQTSVGQIQQRIIIDGQQRLTTLQLMFDAIHAQLEICGAKQAAERLKKLIENDSSYCNVPEDKYKVWPTNRDRVAFNEVLSAEIPVDYSELTYGNSKMAQAHKFFSDSASEWLSAKGEAALALRAEILEKCCRELLQVVVIDLAVNENAQEIFETLNARGAVLTPADLIKNFVFQRLQEQKENVEVAYEKYWKIFETSFWEREISYGRIKIQRSSLFINQWLTTKIGEEVLNREVFSTFKHYADFEYNGTIPELLKEIHEVAERYEKILREAEVQEGQISVTALFAYRLSCLDQDVLRPILIHLLDPADGGYSESEIEKSLQIVESWMVRRLLVRAGNKNYNKVVLDVLKAISNDRANPSAQIEKYFKNSRNQSSYWPDDDEVKSFLSSFQIYRKLNKSRIRMILEALEDQARGWVGGKPSKSGVRVIRNQYVIEHLMPQAWHANWPLEGSSEQERKEIVQTLGNLTLLTNRLNSSVSNSDWQTKKVELHKHDVLLLNREIEDLADDAWIEEKIKLRTSLLVSRLIEIWPTPKGHKAVIDETKTEPTVKINVIDLMTAGLISSGQILYPKQKKLEGKTATVLDDGRIEVEGHVFNSLSLAGSHLRKKLTSGWVFWLVDPIGKKTMGSLREQYLEMIGAESDDEDDVEDSDED